MLQIKKYGLIVVAGLFVFQFDDDLKWVFNSLKPYSLTKLIEVGTCIDQ